MAVLALACALVSCSESPAPEPPVPVWPEGTAFALGTVAIPESELEFVADALGAVNQAHTRRALRREALVAQLLPRAAARLAALERAQSARLEAEAALAVLRGESDGPKPKIQTKTGVATQIGFDLWCRARLAPLNRWEGPFEGVGNWFLLRVLKRESLPGVEDPTGVIYDLEWVESSFKRPGWEAAASDQLLEREGVVAVKLEFADLIPYTIRAVR